MKIIGGGGNPRVPSLLCIKPRLSYVSMDDVVRLVEKSGRGAYLPKADIKQAYRMVPVHPEDRPLLGMV